MASDAELRITTMKCIAEYVGRSVRWCRYMTSRHPDPLPTFKIGGQVCMDIAAYAAWIERQRTSAPHDVGSYRKLHRTLSTLIEEYSHCEEQQYHVVAEHLRTILRDSVIGRARADRLGFVDPLAVK